MYDLIIIGGGAAGLFLAANIKNKKILLIEKMAQVGKKILITGGGMCNLTNCDETDSFLSSFGSKKKINFLKPSMLNLPTSLTRKWFEQAGLELVVRDDGKVFPKSLKAKSVVDLLKKRSSENGVEIIYSKAVKSIAKKNNSFFIETEKQIYESGNVVITTGGKSYESTGSDGSGYLLAKSLGHKIVEPTQALVAVNVCDYIFAQIAGNSIRDAFVDFYRENDNKRYLSACGDLLFTHKGISGPVILNNSREIRKNDLIKVSLISVENKEQSRADIISLIKNNSGKNVSSILKEIGIISALSIIILELIGINRNEKCGQLNKKNRNKLIMYLLEYPLKVSRKGYFSSAMVTAGGVDINEINRKTMESKIISNLYFAGEVLDIDGNTGGYNIQAAFSMAKLISDNIFVDL